MAVDILTLNQAVKIADDQQRHSQIIDANAANESRGSRTSTGSDEPIHTIVIIGPAELETMNDLAWKYQTNYLKTEPIQ